MKSIRCAPRAFYLLLGVVLTLYPLAGAENPDYEEGTLILKNADFNQNRFINNELVSTLDGNVIFEYEDMTIYSDYARWWRDKGNIHLNRNVRVEQEHQLLTCDRLHFYQERNLLIAMGNFNFFNYKENLQLTGRKGEYDLKKEEFELTGQPRFYRYDTTAAETLTIVGERMIYNDSLKDARVLSDVKITKGALVSTCDSAHYLMELERAFLRHEPEIDYDIHKITGDSVDLVFLGDSLKGVSVHGNTHGIYLEPQEKDTTRTNIWSDSMYMVISPDGALDTIRAFGEVHSTYFLGTESDTANEVFGKRMILTFQEEGEIDNASVYGNARSIYFISDAGNRGRNEATGDSIKVYFENGDARLLTMGGSVRGSYFPDTR